MAKDTYVQQTEAELKAVAKAVGASLKRAGHPVPHSTMLHAVAAALNKRDWHKLKASLRTSPVAEAPAPQDKPASEYDDRTWFFLRLAKALNKPVSSLPTDNARALTVAIEACGSTIDGVLKWGGWTMPATLTYKTARIDPGAFRPSSTSAGQFLVSLPAVGQVSLEVGYTTGDGWYVSAKGSAHFYAELERRVSREDVLAAALPSARLPVGPHVKAEFWTDDRAFETTLDARPYLMQASDSELIKILEVGYVGDSCTDAVAEYLAEKGLNEDLNEAFAYIGALQRTRRKDSVGFECRVDEDDYLDWMNEQRPLALARALCERADVRFVQAEEEEVQGRWDWLDNQGNASAMSFETQDEAVLDAYRTLGLLQLAHERQL